MARPFEKDDFVILINKQVGTVLGVEKIKPFYVGSIERMERPLYVLLEGKKVYLAFEHIKHIRTPRKGSKEARDIVAMLLSNARDAKKRYYLSFDYAVAYYVSKRLYDNAKSMLK